MKSKKSKFLTHVIQSRFTYFEDFKKDCLIIMRICFNFAFLFVFVWIIQTNRKRCLPNKLILCSLNPHINEQDLSYHVYAETIICKYKALTAVHSCSIKSALSSLQQIMAT